MQLQKSPSFHRIQAFAQMSTETTERNEVEVKKGYNPEEVKTVVDVLDQRALMNIITSELPSYTGSKMLKLSKLGINKVETLSCLDHLNRLDLSYNKLKSVRVHNYSICLRYRRWEIWES